MRSGLGTVIVLNPPTRRSREEELESVKVGEHLGFFVGEGAGEGGVTVASAVASSDSVSTVAHVGGGGETEAESAVPC